MDENSRKLVGQHIARCALCRELQDEHTIDRHLLERHPEVCFDDNVIGIQVPAAHLSQRRPRKRP
jgi:hypothetical protein